MKFLTKRKEIYIKRDIVKEICEQAYLEGKFLFRSGQLLNVYFDKYLFEANPDLIRKIPKGMCQQIPKDMEVFAGLEMREITLVTAIGLDTGIQCAFVRKVGVS